MDNYPQVSIDNAGEELNRLHNSIESKMRSTVQDAIRAGEILTAVKEQEGHGDFLSWVAANCSFNRQTAWRYMKLHEHRKSLTAKHLQDAYRQIETIEKQEAQTEKQKARQRVDHYIRTGEKQEGWRRGTDDKLVEDEKEWQARKEEMNRDFQREHEEHQARKQSHAETFDFLDGIAERALQEDQKRRSFKDRIRLSDSGKDDAFVDALMDYIEELPDDNRRIEACYNIIKVAKNVAVELQRGASTDG